MPLTACRVLSGYGPDLMPSALRLRKNQVLVPEQLLKCVFFLGEKDKDGAFIPRGTAFFTIYQQGGGDFMQAVTAAHVVRKIIVSGKIVYGRANLRDSEDVLEFPISSDAWRFHAGDGTQEADVAMCPIQPKVLIEGGRTVILDCVAVALNGPQDQTVTKERLKALDYGLGDEIVIVGLFRNHYGKQRNYPIVRMGSIAAGREEPVNTLLGPMDCYLIEALSIGGISGSPVFVTMPLISPTTLNGRSQIRRNFRLLGLVHGHFDIKDLHSDSAVDDAGGGSINTGIGIVVPVERIHEMLEEADLKEIREAAVKESRANSGGTLD